MQHLRLRLARLAGRAFEGLGVGLVRAVFGLARALGPDRSAALGAWLTRTVGPLLPAHRTASANVAAAFPDLPAPQRAAIVRGAWDNLGRTAAEYAHLDTIFDFDIENPGAGRIEVDGIPYFEALRDDGRPGIIFSAHLANWELPAICAARYGLSATAVFRAPNNGAVARAVLEVRSRTMGGLEAARQGAAFAMAGVLDRGEHLGMLIDQHFTRGVPVTFMGRPAMANPILGKLARRYDCPVHGVRVIRLPKGRFRIVLTPPLDLPRDAAGEIDVAGAMQAMTNVVEGWVREHPEQWLWQHRRWRQPPVKGR